MRVFSRIMILTAFLALPLITAVPNGWADEVVASAKTTVYQDTEVDIYDDEDDMDAVSDPIEGWNRVMFTFNDLLYYGIIRPIAKVYAFIAPEEIRIMIRNFFHNLEMPKHFFSALFQGDVRGAGRELGRFGINTVLGLGLFDAAEKAFDMPAGNEDIGQALGHHGAGDGLYIVWPVIGPSNLRDTVGLIGDAALSPLTYVPEDGMARAGIHAGKMINNTSLRIGEYEDLVEASIDPYIALRDAYLQMRRKKIAE